MSPCVHVLPSAGTQPWAVRGPLLLSPTHRSGPQPSGEVVVLWKCGCHGNHTSGIILITGKTHYPFLPNHLFVLIHVVIHLLWNESELSAGKSSMCASTIKWGALHARSCSPKVKCTISFVLSPSLFKCLHNS